jgi:hypothetical protein
MVVAYFKVLYRNLPDQVIWLYNDAVSTEEVTSRRMMDVINNKQESIRKEAVVMYLDLSSKCASVEIEVT